MKSIIIGYLLYFTLFFSYSVIADEKIELDTTVIQGNKELPKILYVVPWQDNKSSKGYEQKLVLHSLFGDLFDPVVPDIDFESEISLASHKDSSE